MKLLPKSIVNTEIASQTRKQIDEGLLIAKKVDALRQTLASLEQQQAKFIEGMRDELNSQTKPLIDEIAQRKAEIETLKAKREELLVPLTREWNDVYEREGKISVLEDTLSKERATLKKNEEVLENRLKKEKETVFKINTIKNEISKVLKQEEENKKNTEVALKSATDTLSKANKEAEERIQAIKERDAKVAVREREVQLLKESLDAGNKWIKEEKIRLEDQRLTLERGLNRIKNK